MKVEQIYLSDEELESLVADIETHDLVQAPPDLLNQILHKIDESNSSLIFAESKNSSSYMQRNKTIEFRKYCFQVITSIAAAIILIFLLPTSMIQKAEAPFLPSKDIILAKQTVKTKSDVLKDNSRNKVQLENFFKDIEWFQMFE